MSGALLDDPALDFLLRTAGQTTLILAVGLLAAQTLAGRPARAHRALILAILAALGAPAASSLVRIGNLGIIASPAPLQPTTLAPTTIEPPGISSVRRADQARETIQWANTNKRKNPDASSTFTISPKERVYLPDLVRTLGGVWLAATIVLLLRLIGAFWVGARFCARAATPVDPALTDLVDEVARVSGAGVVPEVRVHPDLPCPSIWGWGRRPTLILPTRLDTPEGRAATQGGSEGLAAILGHELAHAERRDHIAALLGEVLVAVLPWQPLAWMARRRAATLAERAADDWTLARLGPGRAPDYAEALVGWATDRRRFLLLAAVTRPSELVARVRHILKGAAPMPDAGRRWNQIASTLAVGLVALLALGQSRTSPVQAAPNPPAEVPMDDPPTQTTNSVTLTGIVVDPAGAPIVGADVRIVALDAPQSRLVQALAPILGGPRLRVVARGTTDAAGRYKLDATLPKTRPGGDEWAEILVHRPGSAPSSTTIWHDLGENRITLAPAVPIRGRLLRPDGTPAVGVRVRLDGYNDFLGVDERFERSCYFQRTNWAERPSFLPEAVVTAADGRFTLDGFVPAETFATLRVESPDHAVEELVVSTQTTVRATPVLQAFEQQPLPREFTRTLKPARVVVGTITDAATAKPIAGLAVMVTPMGRHGGMPVQTTTDAAGRYRVADKDGETYFVAAIPEAGSDLVGEQKMLPMPKEQTELRVDIPLRRGVVIRGRVVDSATGGPVAGAGVVYRPAPQNPQARPTDLFRGHPQVTARTNADGRFAITGLPGRGMVGVDANDESFIRSKVDEDDAYPHGLTRFDVADAGAPPEVIVRLRRGVALEATITRPDGTTPDYVMAWCPELSAHLLDNQFLPVAFVGGRFRLDGAEPGRTYRVILLDRNQRSGAVVDLRAEAQPAGPIAVPLKPTASLRGRVVDAAGKPPAQVQVLAHVDYLARGDRLTQSDLYDDMTLPLQVNFGQGFIDDQRPDFPLDGLIPGVGYVLTWSTVDGKPEQCYHVVGPLAPGEVRELGDIRPGSAPARE